MEKKRATLRDYNELPEPLKRIILDLTDKHTELSDDQIQSIVTFLTAAYIEGVIKSNNNEKKS